ncbi:MAG TPA: zf-HC2 domain-containing protein [Bryobacteraceae bacterium]|nr:zf-HC2 domain-containing protein [Bryobacteraceae bacterium]
MHAVVMESLEEYLSGMLKPAAQREIEAHLSNCGTCREELRGMQDVSQMLGAFRTGEVLDPVPGFYARVMNELVQRKPVPSFASLFGFDAAFGRRVVFASLLTLAVLGSYLVSRETHYSSGPSPDVVMAQQDSPSFDSAPAPDNMLVTLTTYEHQ